MTLLAGRAITKAFGSSTALDGADPSVGAGAAFGPPRNRIRVAGPNGSGTSMLLKILARLERTTTDEG